MIYNRGAVLMLLPPVYVKREEVEMHWERDLQNRGDEPAYLNLNLDQLSPPRNNLSTFGVID